MKKDLIEKMNDVESIFKALSEVKTDELNWKSEYLFVLENRLDKNNQKLREKPETIIEKDRVNEI